MKVILKILNIIGILAIVILIFIFSNDKIKGQEYEYEFSDNQFVVYSIKNAIKENHNKKIIDFNGIKIQHLSGKTFKLSGTVVFEGVFNNRINEKFECVATGMIWETNPSDTYRINMYMEK